MGIEDLTINQFLKLFTVEVENTENLKERIFKECNKALGVKNSNVKFKRGWYYVFLSCFAI